MAQLELITRRPTGKARSTPLLFVHGAFCGAWIWDVHFLPYFAERGYDAHALSLRGHGASEGRHMLPWAGVADYVADLIETVASFDRPPVLIGHSMGGYVVQRGLARAGAPAAVLMASTPHDGLLGPLLGMAWRQPLMLHQLTMAQAFGAHLATWSVLKRALFSDEAPDEWIDGFASLFQDESRRVSFEMLYDPSPPSTTAKPPMMVLGAGRDAFLSADDVARTARAYDVEAAMFPGLAHCMMLEPRWRTVADAIADWLDETLA
jgi:pimeloyl-ACP methyl ester carboxylesterase